MNRDVIGLAKKLDEAGWQVLALPPGEKGAPTTGYTGHEGSTDSVLPTSPDQNLALRLPPTVVGIDVDDYQTPEGKQKSGATTLAALERECGPLPTTDRITSRGRDNPSGVRLFRVEPGTELVTQLKDEDGNSDIECVQFHHRYVVMAPSVHPDTGEQYEILPSTEGRFALLWDGPDAIPWLPQPWIQRLHKDREQVPIKGARQDAALSGGEPCPKVQESLERFSRSTKGGRYDTVVPLSLGLCSLGSHGHPGVKIALDQLRDAYIHEVAGDRSGGKATAESEFDRALEGALCIVEAPDTSAVDPCGAMPQNLPDSFWESRPELKHIREFAHHCSVSADVVLLVTLARYSAMISPRYQLETGVGRASLNLFVLNLGHPGAGKSQATSRVRELIPKPIALDFKDGVGSGSGEGLIEAFMGEVSRETGEVNKDGSPKKGKFKEQVREHVFVTEDEGDKFLKTSGRTDSTVTGILAAMWTADNASGNQNASEDTTRHLEPRSYSLGVSMNFQPEVVQPLLENTGTGVAQRFLWTNAVDENIPYEPPQDPGPLTGYVPITVELDKNSKDVFAASTGPIVMHYPDDLKKQNRIERVDRNTQKIEVSIYDVHEPLTLAKISGLLALLNGRDREVTWSDYALAKQIWETSCHVRDRARYLLDKERRKAEKKKKLDQVKMAGRVAKEKRAALQDVDRVKFRIVNIVEKRNGEVSKARARTEVASRDREHFDEALDAAESEGLVIVDEKRETTVIYRHGRGDHAWSPESP